MKWKQRFQKINYAYCNVKRKIVKLQILIGKENN